MLAKEMHIQFGLGLQKLGAGSRRKFYEQEIDAILNLVQDQFVMDAVKVETDAHGFQRIQVDVDKIRPLIVRDAAVTAWYEDATPQFTQYKAQLPGDYAFLVSDTWVTAKKCSTTTATQLDTMVARIPFNTSAKSSTPFYTGLTLADGNFTLALASQIPNSLYTGLAGKDDKYKAIELLREIFHEMKRRPSTGGALNAYDLYWERYGDQYYPGHLLLVKTNNANVTLTFDSTTTTASTATSTLLTENRTQHSSSTNEYYRYPSRLIKSSVIDYILSTPYYKPTGKSPVSTIVDGEIFLYTSPSHIVNKGLLTYVRKAGRINLSLQRNCELAPEFHQQIVDRAVAYAAGHIEQAGLFQVQTAENLKNQ